MPVEPARTLGIDMHVSVAGHVTPLAINLNQPSHVYHWSFITITLANLIVIAIMVVVFGLALLVRFPHRGSGEAPAAYGEAQAAASAARSRGTRACGPPGSG